MSTVPALSQMQRMAPNPIVKQIRNIYWESTLILPEKELMSLVSWIDDFARVLQLALRMAFKNQKNNVFATNIKQSKPLYVLQYQT